MYTAPSNLFCLIQKALSKKPHRLNTDHWHTMPDGTEALTPHQILHPECSHDLSGWIVLYTPMAIQLEQGCQGVDDLAQDILRVSQRKPIPWGLVWGTVEDQLAFIKRRADEERSIN